MFTLVSEIVIANENQSSAVHRRPRRSTRRRTWRTRCATRVPRHEARPRIVCRTGDPSSLQDLAMVNVTEARSIVVLGERRPRRDQRRRGGQGRAGGPEHATPRLGPAHRRRAERSGETARALARGELAGGSSRCRPPRSSPGSRPRRAGSRASAWCAASCSTSTATRSTSSPRPSSRATRSARRSWRSRRRPSSGAAPPTARSAVHPPMDTVFGPGDEVDRRLGGRRHHRVHRLPPTTAVPRERSTGTGRRGRERFLVVGWNPLGPVILRRARPVRRRRSRRST